MNSKKRDIKVQYDLLLIDEDIKKIPQDGYLSISFSAIEFVLKLGEQNTEEFFKSKTEIHTLYVSSHPEKIQVACQYTIDTCFLNNGINDIGNFDRTCEFPYTKRLTKNSTNK